MPLFHRKDGDLVPRVSLTRAVMPYIMPSRAGSSVYFEQELDVTNVHAFAARRKAAGKGRVTLFQVFTYAAVQTLKARPRLNRFTSGGRVYQRREIQISFSAKKSMSDDAAMVAIKRTFDPDASFEEHVERLSGGVAEGRSKKLNSTERELSILLRLPGLLLALGVAVARWLDAHNLLPQALIADDPLYTSAFVANLGSVGLDAVYHHLYEWGNCPIFAAIGRVRDVVRDGVPRKVCTVRYTFDERIEDGLYCARSIEALRTMIESWGADEAQERNAEPTRPLRLSA